MESAFLYSNLHKRFLEKLVQITFPILCNLHWTKDKNN